MRERLPSGLVSAVAWQLGGGIGSGKSTVRRMLEELGVQAIDADSIGHEVLAPGAPAFEAVATRWPEVVVEHRIDRAALGRVVFASPEALAELESYTHPHIFGRIMDRLQSLEGPVVIEIPLLDSPAFSGLGRIVVDCEDEIRVRRVVERGMAETEARQRMATQPSRAQWLASADIVVPNHDGLEELWAAVRSVRPLLD